MRRNIAMQYDTGKKIYIYTHWGADGMELGLAYALEHGRDRWGDESYLARIITSAIFRDEIDGLTGYGIAPYECDPEYPTLEVDLNENTVNGVSFGDFIADPRMFSLNVNN